MKQQIKRIPASLVIDIAGTCLMTLLVVLFLAGCATTTQVVNENAVSIAADGEATDKSPEKAETAEQTNAAEEVVLATVNGETITIKEYNEKLKRLSAFERARYRSEAGHKNFLDALILQLLMVQKAKQMGLDQDEDVRSKIEALTREVTERVLADALVEREVMDKTVVTDKEAKEYYAKHRDEFVEKEKISARHILVATEEEAQAILDELANGADFAKLAEEKSKDRGTAKKGGDLGYFERGSMTPDFEEACLSLQIGEISGIVKTVFGYHIIKLEDKKEASPKEFYEVTDEIKKKLIADKRREAYQNWIEQLKKEAKIEKDEEFLTQ